MSAHDDAIARLHQVYGYARGRLDAHGDLVREIEEAIDDVRVLLSVEEGEPLYTPLPVRRERLLVALAEAQERYARAPVQATARHLRALTRRLTEINDRTAALAAMDTTTVGCAAKEG